VWTHRSRMGQAWRRDSLRVLDPLLRRLTSARPWCGIEDPALDARVDKLPHAPPREPLHHHSRPARWMITPR
jgi:hypothetical protein